MRAYDEATRGIGAGDSTWPAKKFASQVSLGTTVLLAVLIQAHPGYMKAVIAIPLATTLISWHSDRMELIRYGQELAVRSRRLLVEGWQHGECN